MANVALLVPVVLFAALATRRPLLALAAGTGASVLVEAVQALTPALGRACDTNDWSMNTVGAVLGAALAWLLLRGVTARRGGLPVVTGR
nr:VanZ family protein [Modestobacter versicolor]